MPRIVFDPPKTRSSRPSLFLGLALLWVTLKQSILFLLEALFKGVGPEMSGRHIKRFWQELFYSSHTQLRVGGISHIEPERSYVYMSNHQSVLDIPAILGAAPGPLRMVAKEILFKIPFFGAAMRGAGFIPIDRKNLSKAKQQLEQAKSKLQSGMSIWIAPEGTRSRKIELLPFKKGGFHVALALGVPIVPAWIEGAREIIPADGAKVRPNRTIVVHLGKPIETAGMTTEDLPKLMQRVRYAILELAP